MATSTSKPYPKFRVGDLVQTVDIAPAARKEIIQVALSGYDTAISTGARKAEFQVPFSGSVTSFSIACDPANEPSASSVQVDLNTVDLSTGTATSLLTAVATIATSANAGTGTLKTDGTEDVSAGDYLTIDIDQGTDGKGLIAIIEITPS